MVLVTLIMLYVNNNKKNKPKTSIDYYDNDFKKKGICFFDIDDTLTPLNKTEAHNIIQECINNDFDIGISTASYRDIYHLCDGDKSNQPYIPDNLCKNLKKNNYVLFNSLKKVAGSDKRIKYPINFDYGMIKGHNMVYSKNIYNSNIPNKCIVFFDDQKGVINGVKRYNSDINTFLVNKGSKKLNVNRVSNILKNVKKYCN